MTKRSKTNDQPFWTKSDQKDYIETARSPLRMTIKKS